jgi:hypothetical protein
MQPTSNNERGQILIINAISLVTLLGVSALALDASFMYDKRNRLFAAADAAAKSAAIEVRRNPSIGSTDLETFAYHEIAALGFNPGGTTTVVVNHPPLSGPFRCAVAPTTCTNYVEVVASESTGTFFGRLFGFMSLTPGGRAVAGTSPSTACVTALEDSGTAFQAGNNFTLTAPSCDLALNGNMTVGSYDAVSASSIGVSGSCSGSCPSPPVTTGTPLAGDPLSTLPAPPDPSPLSSCIPAPATPLPDVKYCGWAPLNGTVANLAAGIYYFTGAINPGNNVTISGTDVMIYLAPGASIIVDGNGDTVNLTGRVTDATYKGIVLYQDRANTNAANLGKNNGTIRFVGAIYMPGADLSMKNDGLASPCSIVIANSLTVKNNAGLQLDNSCNVFGGSPLSTVSVAE